MRFSLFLYASLIHRVFEHGSILEQVFSWRITDTLKEFVTALIDTYLELFADLRAKFNLNEILSLTWFVGSRMIKKKKLEIPVNRKKNKSAGILSFHFQ